LEQRTNRLDFVICLLSDPRTVILFLLCLFAICKIALLYYCSLGQRYNADDFSDEPDFSIVYRFNIAKYELYGCFLVRNGMHWVTFSNLVGLLFLGFMKRRAVQQEFIKVFASLMLSGCHAWRCVTCWWHGGLVVTWWCSLYSYSSFTCHLKTFYFNTAFNEWLLLGHLVTARASDSMFLSIDFVHVTNCFYDYDFANHAN